MKQRHNLLGRIWMIQQESASCGLSRERANFSAQRRWYAFLYANWDNLCEGWAMEENV